MLAVLSTPMLHWRPPANGIFVNTIGLPEGQALNSVILDRRGQFQTELFLGGHKQSETASHTHIGVDSYELFLSGDMMFSIQGQEDAHQFSDGRQIGERQFVEVPEDFPHAAKITGGAAFLSFQYWKDAPPSTIGNKFEVITKGEKNG